MYKYSIVFCTHCETIVSNDDDGLYCNCSNIKTGGRSPQIWYAATCTIDPVPFNGPGLKIPKREKLDIFKAIE